jgi:hypothetical protein
VPMPATIRVGYIDFTVINWPYGEASANGSDGECLMHLQIIRVRDDLQPSRKANVLLHEVLHAAYNIGDLTDTSTEEKTVTVLANQMTQVWRDNPEFIAFMEGSLR